MIAKYQQFLDSSNFFTTEADYINYLLNQNDLDIVIDFGCNLGNLANKILTNSSIKKYYGIDAVPEYLTLSKKFINDDRFIPINGYITNNQNSKEHFSIDLNNLVATSTELYTQPGYKVNLSQAISPTKWLATYLPLFHSNVYCKIDIDVKNGEDIDLLDLILNTGVGGIQIELNVDNYDKFISTNLIEKLTKLNFLLPTEFFNQFDSKSQFANLAVTKKGWWYQLAVPDDLKRNFELTSFSSWGHQNKETITTTLS